MLQCKRLRVIMIFSEQVWFLEEETLPVVSSSVEEHSKHKILMKSPWEFLQRPIGSGGVFSLLSSHDSLLDELGELGVEYIQVRLPVPNNLSIFQSQLNSSKK